MSGLFVLFAHGRDSRPWGGKITVMAKAVRARGIELGSLDYRAMPRPEQRIEHLLAEGRTISARGRRRLVLVGSSMGGYVSAVAAPELGAAGLFLIAPALGLPGYERYRVPTPSCPVTIVHGWEDEIVPVANSIRYAEQHRASLHVLAGDHRLLQHSTEIAALLGRFLDALH